MFYRSYLRRFVLSLFIGLLHFLVVVLNLLAVGLSAVSAGFMFHLSRSIGEKRLKNIFGRLGFVMVGVFFLLFSRVLSIFSILGTCFF